MNNINQHASLVLAARAGDIVESNGFEPMPNADYILRLNEANVKATKAADGKFLEAVFEVCQENGKFVGRKIWYRFNFENKSQQAANIGIGQLKAFCRVSRGELNQDEQFTLAHVQEGLGVPFVGRVKITSDTNKQTGEVTKGNDITSFIRPFDALNEPAPQPQQSAPQQGGFAQQQHTTQQHGSAMPFAQQQHTAQTGHNQ